MAGPDSFDAIVMGGGAAGSAAALTLRQRGVDRVAIVERSDFSRPRIGETVPPDINLLLSELGLFDLVRTQGHLPCHGSRSAWGSRALGFNDFLVNPYGHGWHLDRSLFDRSLFDETGRRGVTQLRGAEFVAVRGDRRVAALVVRLPGGEHRTLSAPSIVDASGQPGVIARSMGARKQFDDLLVVISAVFSLGRDTGIGHTTWLEGAREGWWYASQLPDRKVIVALGTDPRQAKSSGLFDLGTWLLALTATDHIAGLLRQARLRQSALSVANAHSYRVDRVMGPTWIAAGDAALAFDPLSSAGIYKALDTGRRAALALTSSDPEGAMAAYGRSIVADYDAYLVLKGRLYAAETRWRDLPFWKKRLGASVVEPATSASSAIGSP